jgi:hypothetical protein
MDSWTRALRLALARRRAKVHFNANLTNRARARHGHFIPMNTSSGSDPTPTLSASAVLEWEGHAESVLRGVAHALNNRAASMSALMSLCMEPDYTPKSTRDMLASEVSRLHEIVGVVRTIGVSTGDAEAFEPADAANTAKNVLALHPAMRDRGVSIKASAGPVRAQRWMFVRALVVLAGRAATADRAAAITLELSEREGWVYALAEGATVKGRSAYLDEIAVAMGGKPLPDAAGFRLPTLATVRQREGR